MCVQRDRQPSIWLKALDGDCGETNAWQRGGSVVASSEMAFHPEDPLMASLQPRIRVCGLQPNFCGLRSRRSVAQWDRSLSERPTIVEQRLSGQEAGKTGATMKGGDPSL